MTTLTNKTLTMPARRKAPPIYQETEAPPSYRESEAQNYERYINLGIDFKLCCKVATTKALFINKPFKDDTYIYDDHYDNKLEIDGVIIEANDRILVKNESDKKNNGIYIVVNINHTLIGNNNEYEYVYTRADDFVDDMDIKHGSATRIEKGDENGGKGFILTTIGPFEINKTELNFEQFS